jgi:hypothetical protein
MQNNCFTFGRRLSIIHLWKMMTCIIFLPLEDDLHLFTFGRWPSFNYLWKMVSVEVDVANDLVAGAARWRDVSKSLNFRQRGSSVRQTENKSEIFFLLPDD